MNARKLIKISGRLCLFSLALSYTFLIFLILSPSNSSRAAFAAASCTVCLEEISEEPQATAPANTIKCAQGHFIHSECIGDQIRGIEDVLSIKTKGIRCGGLNSDDTQCKQILPYEEIRKILSPAQLESLDTRLHAAAKPNDQSFIDQEVHRLSRAISDAFNLICPIDGCGCTLDKIELCNAAVCPNPECKAAFCYLCLESQENDGATHWHTQGHSGDYWEKRPGYVERYHWLVVRKKLAFVLNGRAEAEVRGGVLHSQRKFLEERNMWPFPAGIMSSDWIVEVQNDTQLSTDKKIELLQNEAIFRRQAKDFKNAALVEVEIRKLGGAVLSSLDVRDAGGVAP
jgi:hypothetical protein